MEKQSKQKRSSSKSVEDAKFYWQIFTNIKLFGKFHEEVAIVEKLSFVDLDIYWHEFENSLQQILP
jgi:hypothetical protein